MTAARNSIAASFGERTTAIAKPRQHADETSAINKGKCTTTSEGVEFEGVVIDEEIDGDWGRIFRIFGKDPAAFIIVDDTVRESTWEQSASDGQGNRDKIQLWSYSARFRRRSADEIPAATVKAWRQTLMVRDRPAKAPEAAVDAGTYVIAVADPQLGKKGTEESVHNWRRGVTGHLKVIQALGAQVERIHVAYMGDEVEGVMSNYANQLHTVELNKSAQLELDYDLRTWTTREALALGLPVTCSSVISNHGEWTRAGGKDPMTTRNDNASTFIARQVQSLFDELAPYTHQRVEWTIGDTRPGVLVDLSGVETYLTHAYVEKGKGPTVESRTVEAIKRQILGNLGDYAQLQLAITAHYHHAWLNTFEGHTVVGCAAAEAKRSSEYMLDQYGVWSEPGVTGLLVGAAFPNGWTHLSVI